LVAIGGRRRILVVEGGKRIPFFFRDELRWFVVWMMQKEEGKKKLRGLHIFVEVDVRLCATEFRV